MAQAFEQVSEIDFDRGADVPELASDVSSLSSSVGGRFALSELKPYQNYLPVAKRGALALKEFEVQMLERELKVRELDRSLQKYTAPKMRTYTLPFTLNDKQLALATSRYPRTIFKCGVDAGHDHPIAHLETMIAAEAACRMIPAGHTVYDLFGSPKRCAAANRAQRRSDNPKVFHAYVALKTEKDYIRALSWDEHPHIKGRDLMTDFQLRYNLLLGGDIVDDHPADDRLYYLPCRTTFLMVHTLYYVTEEEICGLLSPDSTRIVAVVHRHAADKGVMFDGEATYAKIEGTVEQINSMTGERYVHRDLSYLFTSKSKVVYSQFGAYAWTLHKQTDETWIVVMVGVDRMNERFSSRARCVGQAAAAEEMNRDDVAPTHFPHPALAALPGATCTMVGGIPVVSVSGTHLTGVHIESPDLIEYLRLHLAGKPRDAVRLQDAYSLARTHVRDGSDFAGKRNFKCSAAGLSSHVGLAFLSDLTAEVDVLRAVSTYHLWVKEHAALSNGVHLVRPDHPEGVGGVALRAANMLNAARKSGDTFDAILGVLS